MKNLLFTIAFLIVFSVGFAQTINVPENYTLKTKDDFSKYQNQAIECMKWLDNDKFDEYVDIRKNAYKFVLSWIVCDKNSEFTFLEVIINDIISDKHPFTDELVMAYFTGVAKSAILNPKKDKLGNQLDGINNLIEVAKNNSHLNFKSKAVNKYTGLRNNTKLEVWLTTELEKANSKESQQSSDATAINFWFMK